ncbi:MAG: hypothetical protein HFJ02_00295 [Bacilli bacterium]|nr:hypothetical protein [Bacilli bacterium]
MSVRDKYYSYKIKKRYKQFKNCSLPFPFFDKKRDCFEWVRKEENDDFYDRNSSLFEVLGNAASSGVTYHYEANILSRTRESVWECNVEISHGHSFEDIVEALYSYPNSFHIPDEFKREYSEQELAYLNKVQKYLNFIGVRENPYLEETNTIYQTFLELEKKKKTLKNRILYYKNLKAERKLMFREKIECAENQKAKEYADYRYYKSQEPKEIESFLNGQKQEFISPLYSPNRSNLHQKYFLVDNEYNYLAILEIVEEIKMPFKELTEEQIGYDKEKYKNFLEFKKELKNDFKERFKYFNEGNFTENSMILIEKLKIERINQQ